MKNSEIELLVNVNMENVTKTIILKLGKKICSGIVFINNDRMKMFVIKVNESDEANIFFSNDIVYDNNEIYKDNNGIIEKINKIM